MDVVPQEINNKSEKRNALLKYFSCRYLNVYPYPKPFNKHFNS